MHMTRLKRCATVLLALRPCIFLRTGKLLSNTKYTTVTPTHLTATYEIVVHVHLLLTVAPACGVENAVAQCQLLTTLHGNVCVHSPHTQVVIPRAVAVCDAAVVETRDDQEYCRPVLWLPYFEAVGFVDSLG